MSTPDPDDVAIVLMALLAIAAVVYNERSTRRARQPPRDDR